MKFGFRVPSLKKRISAKLSVKRKIKNSLGLKAPKGLGIITNPKKAIYNKIYNKTTVDINSIKQTKNSCGGCCSLVLFLPLLVNTFNRFFSRFI